MTAIWAGGEDIEYVPVGGATLTTTSGYYRSIFARCALLAQSDTKCWQSIKAYSQTDFWFSGRLCASATSENATGAIMLQFLDTNLLPRLQIVGLHGHMWKLQKVNSSGTATDIGNAFFYPITLGNTPDKIDIHVNYDVTGSVDIYINLSHVCAFIGDVTTNSVTALCQHRLGGNGQSDCGWSETWLDDEDTRSQSLASFSPVANGNANTFDTGSPSASNINEVTLDVSTLNGSSVAGQIDQYTNGVAPSGTLEVKDVIISAYAQRGTSGPSKLALGVRTNGTDYWGSDQALDIAWTNIQQVFATNPDTSAPWLKSQIGNASGFNIGAKSAA